MTRKKPRTNLEHRRVPPMHYDSTMQYGRRMTWFERGWAAWLIPAVVWLYILFLYLVENVTRWRRVLWIMWNGEP